MDSTLVVRLAVDNRERAQDAIDNNTLLAYLAANREHLVAEVVDDTETGD